MSFLYQNLLRHEPLKLVDGGVSQRTFVYIKDAIEAVMLMIVRSDILPLSFILSFMFDITVAEYCDPFLLFRKIPLEPMAIFLTWATLTMKLQLGSLQK